MGNWKPSARLLFVIVAAVAALSSLALCQNPPDWKGQIENDGGVVVVKNPRKPACGAGAFSLVQELALGGAIGESYVFASISSVAVADDGTIFVLDQKDRAVKTFDREGKFLRSIGKAGEGPGEFSMPVSVHWMDSDELAVTDMRQRVLFFTADGRHVRDLSATSAIFSDARPDSRGNFYIYSIVQGGTDGRYELQKVDGAFKPLFSVESSPLPGASGGGFDPFFPVLRWAVLPGGGVVCGHAVKSELRVRDEAGRLVRRIEMDRDAVAVSREDVEERTKGTPPSVLQNMKVPKHYPSFRYLLADDEGRIYMLCWERPPGRKGYFFDIFDPEGRYLVRAGVPDKQPFIHKGKLYAAEEDEEGNPVLKRYRIDWKL